MSEFVLGDYIFTRKRIGKGAFSTIYKGKHKDMENTMLSKKFHLKIRKDT